MDYHTLLAGLGEGSAHPGGFQATKELIGQIGFPRGTKVLEAGCGTGRTACYLASLGCNVTAIDRNEDMIRKASYRAKSSNLPVRIVQADATSMPFPDETFDAVFTESVTAFTPGSTALREYWRVLKPAGVLYDRELAFSVKLTTAQKEKLGSFYGLHHMRTVPEWLKLLSRSRFSKYSVSSFSQMKQTAIDNDPLRIINHELFAKPAIVAMMMKNERLMSSFSSMMGSIVMTAWKA
ncbi:MULTISPECIES: class I SAM-dependent methyltransferase [unclassified Paenibacillus]|uniref:class I SAM-dependent methyltransferase n=1 Tax=unclassified Paenibacillus TaxID=185978 RepID=UPI0010499875|nr:MULTISPECIES: class I SAM-dependent methyltransferase [unclassified Paenibacillus]NIK71896.1 ubiquinone/menaquinone biosynthesis C-methylase UbiE [Paenibacillus sp. BK720]TCM96543.1 ubiquinone/menaquinone biosynthesis C-methylase UbiE [Paenibacillus sp. BK033]